MHVAVQEAEAELIGRKVDLHGLITTQHHHVLQHARDGRAGDPDELEAAAVQMHGMDVITRIFHAQSVAKALPQAPGDGHRPHVEGCAVDRPTIKALVCRVVFGEEHLDCLNGRGRLAVAAGKVPIVPPEGRRRSPDRLTFGAGVFDDDAHAVPPVIIIKVTEHPDTGITHFDDRADALGGADPERRHFGGVWHRVAIESDDSEAVTGEGEATDLRGAAVEDVKEDSLSTPDSDRLTEAKLATIDGEDTVADFESLLHPARKSRFHGCLTLRLESRIKRRRREKVERHVSSLAEEGLKFLQRQKHLPVKRAGIMRGLYVERSDFSSVLAEVEIAPCVHVRVISESPPDP